MSTFLSLHQDALLLHILPCLSFLPLLYHIIPLESGPLSADWKFLTLYPLSKTCHDTVSWHKAAWLLQPFCITPLLSLTNTVCSGKPIAACQLLYLSLLQIVSLLFYEKPLHGSFHSLSILSFTFKPFFYTAHLAFGPPSHHHFQRQVYITASPLSETGLCYC